jgi:hypothetical protein
MPALCVVEPGAAMSRKSANGHRPRPASGWAALQHQPAQGGPLLHCQCGAAWTDDEEGRHAHRAVFLHQPKPRQTISSPQEDPS